MLRLASLAVIVGSFAAYATAAELPPDVEIEKLLVGRWNERELDGEDSITTTTTFSMNGGWSGEVVIAKGQNKITVKLSGTWRVRDKKLITTVQMSNVPSIPAGTSSEDKLLEIDKKVYRYRDDEDKEHIRTREE